MNFATESILPEAWGYDSMDAIHVKAVHRAHGTIPLKSYKIFSLLERCLYIAGVAGFKTVYPLNFIDYDQAKVKAFLKRELNWQDYGLKHGESYFTRFFQNYWLPTKYYIPKKFQKK